MTHYDRIGAAYVRVRKTEPRIAAWIEAALGNARTVVDVGAGTGSYEPPARSVVAVEPSQVMIAQRPPGAAPAVRAAAEHLPFLDSSFDAGMAVLSVHHWANRGLGLRELRRVVRHRVVVLTWDQAIWESFWLIRNYFPGFVELDRRRAIPFREFTSIFGSARVQPVPIPHDCRDGFAGAFWRRPDAYLDPAVRSGISTFQLMGKKALSEGLQRLAEDLRTGAWAKQFGHLLQLDELDLGYRLLVWET